MADKLKRGYCSSCAENTGHAVVTGFRLSQPFNWFTRLVGFGPWYCSQCRRQVRRIHRPLDSGGGRSDWTEDASVSVGNFIRGEENLVMRRQRSNRFTEKFRVATVQRVLSGKQTLRQISDELEVPQSDILVWIGEQFANKQARIDELSKVIQQLTALRPDQLLLDQSPEDWGASEDDGVVEGRTRTR